MTEDEARKHEPSIVIVGAKNKIEKAPASKAKRPAVFSV